MEFFIVLLFALPVLLTVVEFLVFLIRGKGLFHTVILKLVEFIAIIGVPLFYLLAYDEHTNDCCSQSATFSPDHSLTIYVLISLCVLGFFISSYKKRIISPIIEVLLNALLLAGIVLNIFIAIQVEEMLWLFGNLPIILLFTLQLIENNKTIKTYSSQFHMDNMNRLEGLFWSILNAPIFVKYPILLVLCLPILTIVSSILLLFGQKPDAIIRVFTDTYKHGFSQLDYLCDNVVCGGHFLCSVAAKGHKTIVHPHRTGIRGGQMIMCNRQLLIANAFEELIEENLPNLHRKIRQLYNRVGSFIHQYYGVFNLKWVSNIIYILMKPLEWGFLLILYTFDSHPENRIAQQYLKPSERSAIKSRLLKDTSLYRIE